MPISTPLIGILILLLPRMWRGQVDLWTCQAVCSFQCWLTVVLPQVTSALRQSTARDSSSVVGPTQTTGASPVIDPNIHTQAEMPGDATLLHSIPPPSFCIPGARCLRIAGALPSPALNASPRSATSGPPRLHRPPPASAAVIRPAPHSTAAFTSLAENVAPHAATPARQRSSRRCAVFKFLNQPRRCAGGVPIAPFASVQLLTPVCPPGGSIRPAHRQLQPAGAAARRALPLRCGDDRGRALRVRWPETAAGLSALTVA